ncbi:YqgE/AlgH family protein [Aporhodopirellula aestuarii]|uniref:YqgE/AlgH family protein n=1 Tax=Aporhodopirellula aestuarii TaxID=2950107 RepID=A0ABT0U5T4_9BACT|nr:YqgE/AlgH family protein [Aporhodopirellula aestuarii]MCM2372240.1 YqgE/AlgH family protein [Aporhodopirellula aestuarii]
MRNSQVGDLLVASTDVDGTILNRGVCLLVYEDEQTAIGLMLNRPLHLAPIAIKATGEPASNAPSSPPASESAPVSASHRLAHLLDQDEAAESEFCYQDDATAEAEAVIREGDAPQQPFVALVGPSADSDAGKLLLGKSLHFGGPLSGPIVAVHGAPELGEAEAGEGIFVAAQRDHLEALMQAGQPHPYRLIVGHLGWTQQQLSDEIAAGVWHRIPAKADILSTADEWLWPKLIRSATASSVSRWLGVEHVADSHQLN